MIVSDIERRLFMLDVSQALAAGVLTFSYPTGRPELVSPLGGTSIRVDIAGQCGGALLPGTGMLHYNTGSGYDAVPLSEVSPGAYEGVFPAVPCGTDVLYYFSAQSTAGATHTDPPGAPTAAYFATAAFGVNNVFSDNFQTDQGWTVENISMVGALLGA